MGAGSPTKKKKMRKWNFTAGPSTLPEGVLRVAQAAIWDVGLGAGILEVSHRSAYFDGLMHELEEKFRRLGGISDAYDVLFLQGGATLQFSQIPYALTRPGDHIDCLHTGFWTRHAMRDAARYTSVHYAYDGSKDGFDHIPEAGEIAYSEGARYVHYCANNSFLGTEWAHPPRAQAPLVADMSSNLFSRLLDVDAHSLIFASAQKNLGMAGCCVVIVRRDFLEANLGPNLGSMFDYRRLAEARSMLNTPPTFALFVMKEVLVWIESRGGLAGVGAENRVKAAIVREAIDATGGFFCHIGRADSRSQVTVCFRSPSAALDEAFAAEAEALDMIGLRGHRETGGLRASLFNALPREACLALAEHILDFACRMG